ncbi:hypothetical protein FOS14_18110 [Skermania sp. ID1734]|uniref:hypothetical protein n=1 Tax=Skermania sp. ID1734 TaxID=2597516 RepID=UPI00117E920A|nr:hypothetical protein [Skermania sp. ID1734]TSD95280.1 hypothetical protein FOS14_18110 [Skermania sp. ID1734]
MSSVVNGLLLERDDLLVVQRLIVVAEHARRRNGLPLSDTIARLKTQVNAALADNRTRNEQPLQPNTYREISVSEYATRTGCSQRTARRHAQRHGRKTGGRWLIPIEE